MLNWIQFKISKIEVNNKVYFKLIKEENKILVQFSFV